MPVLQGLGDPDRLSQVLSNLIRNAAEAAGPGGRVVVRGAMGGPDASVASVTVEDSGPGVPEDVRARLFEPFFTTKERGLGLGLAVSLAIAQAHRGTIQAENRPGGGARFTLKVPAAPAPLPPEPRP
jgi:signal transduction histidine kinase